MATVVGNRVIITDGDSGESWRSCFAPLFIGLLMLWLPYLWSIFSDGARRSVGAARGATRGARAGRAVADPAYGAPGAVRPGVGAAGAASGAAAGAAAGAEAGAGAGPLAPATMDPANTGYRRSRKLVEMSLVFLLSLTAGLLLVLFMFSLSRSVCIAVWVAFAFYAAAYLLTLFLGRYNVLRLILELGAAAAFITLFSFAFARYNRFPLNWRL